MPLEAELKARVRDPGSLRAALDARAERQTASYRDRYFDSADGAFASVGYELRIRTVEAGNGVRHIMTFKAPAVDRASGSKPEHETEVGDAQAAEAIITGLGYRPLIAFSKHCANYQLRQAGRDLLASVVTVPEIEGTFLEVETLTPDEADLPAALDDVRAVMASLGIGEPDLTTELYTDAVRAARRS
jgi:adenylate cyclase, class 2